jgi:hypothetical protein
MLRRLFLSTLILASSLSSCTRETIPQDPRQREVCFQRDVLPVLATSCASPAGCHDAGDARGSLAEYSTIMKGIQEGDADGSPYFRVIGKTMPPPGYPQPSADQLALIRQWIDQGAKNTNCGLEFPF